MPPVFDPWARAQNLIPVGEHRVRITDIKHRHIASNDRDAIEFSVEYEADGKTAKGRWTRWLTEDSLWKLAVDITSCGAFQRGEGLPQENPESITEYLRRNMLNKTFRVQVSHRESGGRTFNEITFVPPDAAESVEGNLQDLFA